MYIVFDYFMMIINYYLYRKTSNNQKTRYVEKRTNARKIFMAESKNLVTVMMWETRQGGRS